MEAGHPSRGTVPPEEFGRLGACLPEALDSLYAATLAPQPWPRIMRALLPLFAPAAAMKFGVDRIFPSASTTETVGIPPEVDRAIRNRNLDDDYIWQAVLPMPAGSVYRSTELLPVNILHQGPLYRQVGGAGAGLNYALGAILENTPACFCNLAFIRGEADFTLQEKDLLQRLVPHLRNALQISRRVELGDAGRREALRSFDRARQPMVVLDRSGYAIYTNDAARELVDKGDGLALKFGRFIFANVTIQGEFERVVRRALQSIGKDIPAQPQVVRVPRRGPGSPYAVSVIPLTSSSDRAVLPDGAGCLVLIYDLERPAELAVDRLAWFYRLTPAEVRVAEAVYRMGSVDATAADLSLTRNTVRSHLKSLYAKFGVASLGQLMQRLANSTRLVDGSVAGHNSASP